MDTLCKKKLLLQVICLGVGLLYSTTLGAADSVEEARELAKAKTLNNEERHSDLVRTGSIIPRLIFTRVSGHYGYIVIL